jgi:putative ABC transport system permease protein
MLVVSGRGLTQVQAALPAIQKLARPHGLAVRSWSELEPGLEAAIHLDASTSMLWYVSLVVVVVVLLLNTLLMSVLERTREFGVLLALGMRDGAIGRMVWLELLLLLGIGLGAGILLGGGLVAWYSVHGLALPGAEGVFAQWGLPSRMYPQLSAFSLLTGPAAIALATAVAGVFPYLRIRRLRPVPAMRAV